MSVTVIVPVRNEEKHIKSCLRSILRQTRPLELIVMDNASTDRTFELASQCVRERGKIIRNEKNIGLGASLSRGIRESKGDFILILHADLELGTENYIEKAIDDFHDPRVAIVTGLPYVPAERYERLPFIQKAFIALRRQSEFSQPPSEIEELSFCEEKGDIYRREVLERAGLFSPQFFESGEDQILSYNIRKLGYRIVRDNTIKVIFGYGRSGENFLANLRKEFIYAKTQAGIFKEYGFYPIRNVKLSSQMKYRAARRITALVFGMATLLLSFISILFFAGGNHSLTMLSLLSLAATLIISFWTLLSFLRIPLRLKTTELIGTAALGVATNAVYSAGFAYGLLMSLLRRRL